MTDRSIINIFRRLLQYCRQFSTNYSVRFSYSADNQALIDHFPTKNKRKKKVLSLGSARLINPTNERFIHNRQLKQSEKPASLDLPFIPPMITITSNMSEAESSDVDILSPTVVGKPGGDRLMVPTSGMCYLSPFSICTRGDRTISESNLSSSGYSSMASPGPSRCGSSNPLCLNEMEDPGTGKRAHTFTNKIESRCSFSKRICRFFRLQLTIPSNVGHTSACGPPERLSERFELGRHRIIGQRAPSTNAISLRF